MITHHCRTETFDSRSDGEHRSDGERITPKLLDSGCDKRIKIINQYLRRYEFPLKLFKLLVFHYGVSLYIWTTHIQVKTLRVHGRLLIYSLSLFFYTLQLLEMITLFLFFLRKSSEFSCAAKWASKEGFDLVLQSSEKNILIVERLIFS